MQKKKDSFTVFAKKGEDMILKIFYLILCLNILPFTAKSKNIFDKGIYTAVLTPLNDDLSCDIRELFEHSSDQLQRGCKGVVLFGTTGEGPSFSVAEKIHTLRTLLKMGLNPKKVILSNVGSNLPETKELIQKALELQVQNFLIAPPVYFKNITDKGVIKFYSNLLKEQTKNVHIILYHIPQMTYVPLTAEIIDALIKKYPRNIIGIKDSSGDLDNTIKMIQKFPDLKVFTGNERQIISVVSQGGWGSICGLSNLYPEFICSLFKYGLESKRQNPKELDLYFEATKIYPFIQTFKDLLAKKKGNKWRHVRPPLVPLSHTAHQKLISEKISSWIPKKGN